MDTILLIVLGVCLLVVAVLVYRCLALRGTGTPVLLRTGTDADRIGQWNHGVLRYTERSARLYRLVSIRLSHDLLLDRASIELGQGRAPESPHEKSVLDPNEQIIPFTAQDDKGRTIYGEFGLDMPTHAGMRSWVEACSTNAVRSRWRTGS